MNGPGHMTLGAACGAISAPVALRATEHVPDWTYRWLSIWDLEPDGHTYVWVTAIGAVVGLVMALWPDIDTRGTFTRVLGPIGELLSKSIRFLSHRWYGRKHRGLTHRPWFIALSALPWLALHPALFAAALAGGLSHAWSDIASSAIRRKTKGRRRRRERRR